jgi:hypothetical protein
MADPVQSSYRDLSELSSSTVKSQALQQEAILAAEHQALKAKKRSMVHKQEVTYLKEEICLLGLKDNKPSRASEEHEEAETGSTYTGVPTTVSSKRTLDEVEEVLGTPEPLCRQIKSRSKLRVKDPEKYNNQGLRQYCEFIRHCEVVHCLQPTDFLTDKTKILHTSLSLEGETLSAWLRFEKDAEEEPSWEDFKQKLRDLLQDPVTRSLSQGLRYEHAIQRVSQTVQQFVNYMDEIEGELPPYADIHRRQHLLAKLRPEIRRALNNYQVLPETRTGVINLAIQLEANLGVSKGASPTDRAQSGQGQTKGQQSGSQAEKSSKNQQKPKTDKKASSLQQEKTLAKATNKLQAEGST